MSADDIFYGSLEGHGAITLSRSEALLMVQELWPLEEQRPLLRELMELAGSELLLRGQLPLFASGPSLRSVPASWPGWEGISAGLRQRGVVISSLG